MREVGGKHLLQQDVSILPIDVKFFPWAGIKWR